MPPARDDRPAHPPTDSEDGATVRRSWFGSLGLIVIAAGYIGALAFALDVVTAAVGDVMGTPSPGLAARLVLADAGDSAPWFFGLIGAVLLGLDIAVASSPDAARRERLAALALPSGATVIVGAVAIGLESTTTNTFMLVSATLLVLVLATEVLTTSRRPTASARRAARAVTARTVRRAMLGADDRRIERSLPQTIPPLVVALLVTAVVASLPLLSTLAVSGAGGVAAPAALIALSAALLGGLAGLSVIGTTVPRGEWRIAFILAGAVFAAGLVLTIWSIAVGWPPLVWGIVWAVAVGFAAVVVLPASAALRGGSSSWTVLGVAIRRLVAVIAQRVEDSAAEPDAEPDGGTQSEDDVVVTDAEIEAARVLFGMGAAPVDTDPTWTGRAEAAR